MISAVSILLAACGPSALAPDGGADADTDSPDAPVSTADAHPPPDNSAVYAHSATELFSIDPETLMRTSIGTFSFQGSSENLTDIAIDKTGAMVGISLSSVYSIDPENATTTLLSTFPQGQGGLTSLSFVPMDINDPSSAERLVGADFDGVVWGIDRSTGQRTLLGNYNQPGNTALGSSGDIVSIVGFGILATVNVEGEANDFLARIDPVTWQATVLGNTGRDKIFGIGFWGGKVYGFTDGMELLTLDPSNGAVTESSVGTIRWWGAGVTTLAPIVD
ncbi:MAG TPA: hypothetical protein VML75_23705 [Kofleriaceae bacterium]|nr:hypothetical protein [Kofleriaceae bacterium]